MGQEEKKIINGLQELGMKLPPVVSGVVKSVDEGNALISVELTMNEPDALTENITLSTVKADNEGIILIPKVGAKCIVAAVDSEGGIYTLIRASAYDKIKIKAGDRTLEVKDGQWTFDGGNNGGLTIVGKAKDNFTTLKDYIKNTLEPAIAAGLNAVGAAMQANGATGATAFNNQVSAQQITFEDMENKKIKH